MSRSGYNYENDGDGTGIGLYRGAVVSAMRGRRGQAMFRDLLAALDAIPDRRLIEGYLQHDGEHCALGAVGAARGIDLGPLDVADPEDVMGPGIATALDIADCLAREVSFMNDEAPLEIETPEQRWHRMRAWCCEQLANPGAGG